MGEEIEVPAGDDPPADEPLDPEVDPQDPPDDPDAEPPSEPGDDDEPAEWKALQKKYPHADDKTLRKIIAEGYWNQTKELSRAAKDREELEQLRTRVRELDKGTPPKDEKTPDPPPVPEEVRELEEEITRLDSRLENIVKAQTSLVTDLSTLDTEIKRLEGQLEVAAEHEKDALKARIETREAKYSTKYAEWKRGQERIEDLELLKKRAERDRNLAKRYSQEREARQKKDAEEGSAEGAEFPARIEAMTAALADEAQLPKDEDLRGDLVEYVKRCLTVDFWNIGNKPIDSVDVPGLAKKHVERFAKTHGFAARASFQRTSDRKAAVVAGRPASPRPATPGTPRQSPAPDKMAIARRNLVRKFGG